MKEAKALQDEAAILQALTRYTLDDAQLSSETGLAPTDVDLAIQRLTEQGLVELRTVDDVTRLKLRK